MSNLYSYVQEYLCNVVCELCEVVYAVVTFQRFPPWL